MLNRKQEQHDQEYGLPPGKMRLMSYNNAEKRLKKYLADVSRVTILQWILFTCIKKHMFCFQTHYSEQEVYQIFDGTTEIFKLHHIRHCNSKVDQQMKVRYLVTKIFFKESA